MKQLKILSFNINGLKSFAKFHRKNIEPLNSTLNKYLLNKEINIACFQEIRGSKETLEEFYSLKDYYGIFNHCKKNPNRSGVCIFIKRNLFYSKVLRYDNIEIIKNQGRVLMIEMDKYLIFNIYFPFNNSNEENNSINKFYEKIGEILLKSIKSEKKCIICGDFNATYRLSDNFMYQRVKINDDIKEITKKLMFNEKMELKYLFPSKESLENHFFSKFQRCWLRDLLFKGLIDTFIYFNKSETIENIFTCWNVKLNLRSLNLGSRIDYIFISESIKEDIIKSEILTYEMGSDHCPVLLILNINKEIFSNKINLMEKKSIFSFFNTINNKRIKK